MIYLACDGEVVITQEGSPTCTNWVPVTHEELLNQALSNHLLSSDDFKILSASILAIMIAAMGLRLLLKTLSIGDKHAQN